MTRFGIRYIIIFLFFFMKNSNLFSFNKFSLEKWDPKDYVNS
jgi:hypothetical protein